MSYRIKAGYIERLDPAYFPDADYGHVSQPHVYDTVERLAIETGAHSIIDFGCGRASKLAVLHDRHPEWDFIGIDTGPNLNYPRRDYPWGEWIDADLNGVCAEHAADAVAVCADVVEHLLNPVPVLSAIALSGNPAVISTPDRDLTWGVEHNGPPPNDCHVREWNQHEFVAFLVLDCGFTPERLTVELTESDDQEKELHTIMVTVR